MTKQASPDAEADGAAALAVPAAAKATGDLPAEVPGIVSVLLAPHAVHLVVAVDGDWEHSRIETVAEAEQRCEAAQAFADSEIFRTRYAGRIGVVRLLTKYPPPEIVHQVLTERGIEIEVASESGRGDLTCALCKRRQLVEQQISMTDEGWACPSCFRAWLAHQESARRPRGQSLLSKLSSKLIFPLLLVVIALFVMGVLYELRRLNQVNNVIRQHLPTE